MKVNIKEEIYQCCVEDDVESLHKVLYNDINKYIKIRPKILEELCIYGSWRVFKYLLSICSDVIRDEINFHECLKHILRLEDVEDSASYISLLLMYFVIDETNLYYCLYMYLDMENRNYHRNIGILLYELELDEEDFNDYIYEIAKTKEDAILYMFSKFAKRQYEIALISKILSY